MGATALLAGCVTPLTPYSALRIPAEEFRSRVSTVCVVPVRAEFPLPGGQAKLTELDDVMVSVLKGRSLTAVPPSGTEAVFKRAIEQAGGYYDPHSGWIDEAKYSQVRAQTLQSLKNELGCDALLTATVAVVTAPVKNGTATWDGVAYPVGGGAGTRGWVKALSLWVTIRDLDDREIYFHTGGIEPLASVEVGFLRDTVKPAAPEALLTDPVRSRQAIEAGLDGVPMGRPAAVPTAIPPAAAAPSP